MYFCFCVCAESTRHLCTTPAFTACTPPLLHGPPLHFCCHSFRVYGKQIWSLPFILTLHFNKWHSLPPPANTSTSGARSSPAQETSTPSEQPFTWQGWDQPVTKLSHGHSHYFQQQLTVSLGISFLKQTCFSHVTFLGGLKYP